MLGKLQLGGTNLDFVYHLDSFGAMESLYLLHMHVDKGRYCILDIKFNFATTNVEAV